MAKHPALRRSAVAAAALGTFPLVAAAADIETSVPELRLRWDNTIKYSTAFRLKDPSPALTSTAPPTRAANSDDGDRNFGKGLISNRLDLLSEVDLSYRSSGARVSAAAWYDSVYNRSNNNPGLAGGAVPNQQSVIFSGFSQPANEFPDATRRLHGRKGEILDAFVFGRASLGEATLTARAGKHTLQWGESLFFGANGIAGAQGPVDYVKLLSVPNAQFKEVIRPVNQVSGQLQISPTLSFGAYAQLKWEPDRLPASGSYFSRVDLFPEGGEWLWLGAASGVPRGPDIRPRDSGQYGVQLRWQATSLDTDFGFFAVRFHSKEPQVYLRFTPGFVPQDYTLAYQEGIRAFGASFSKSIGSWTFGSELSTRRNTDLIGYASIPDFGAMADNRVNARYPVGKSLHAQISAVHVFERNDLWDGGLFLGEIAWHRRLSVDLNADQLDPDTTRDASALRCVFSPTFYQALPGLDVSLPLGVGLNLAGRSSVLVLFNGGGGPGSGDLSFGLSGEYLQTWRFGLTYTRFVGAAAPVTASDAANHLRYTFKQSLKDRDFIALSVQRTF
jgi:hypothetical protein